MDKVSIKAKRRKNIIICLIMGLMCVVLAYMPTRYPERQPENTQRLKVRILSVNNDNLNPLGVVFSGTQSAEVELLQGDYKGTILSAANHLNAALDKDKLFEPGDNALAMIHFNDDGPAQATLIDHYRLDTQMILLCLFGVLLVVFAGISGGGALISLILSVFVIWKLLIPLMLDGVSPIPVALGIVELLTAIIMLLVAGFTKKALVAFLGSTLGTLLTCVLSLVFGNLLKLNGGTLPYVVPLIAQGALQIDIREIFFSMVFIANSGALMDLAMDISSSCEEIQQKKPEIRRMELIRSGFTIGRSVVGTMTTTLLLAYSGSYLSMMMYFAGQGTPIIDIFNYQYVSSEILTTLVGSFGLVAVAPFTAVIAGVIYVKTTFADFARRI